MKVRVHTPHLDLIEIDHLDLPRYLSEGYAVAIPEYQVIEEDVVHGRKTCRCRTLDSSEAYEALNFFLRRAYLEANTDAGKNALILSDFEALEAYVHDELLTIFYVTEVY